MGDGAPGNEAPQGMIAEWRAQFREWWDRYTPSQRRRIAWWLWGIAVALIVLIGGCKLLNQYRTAKRQDVGRQFLPPTSRAAAKQQSEERSAEGRSMLPGVASKGAPQHGAQVPKGGGP